MRIIGTGLRGNKVLCPRTHPHVRPHLDTLVVHSPSTDFTSSSGSAVGKSPAHPGFARTRAIERAVPEFRAHRVERRVQARDARAGEEIELLATDHAAHRDPDEPHRAHLTRIA